MERRYMRAIRTGFGSVLSTKFIKVWKCGRMFGRSGVLFTRLSDIRVVIAETKRTRIMRCPQMVSDQNHIAKHCMR
jgi:hypothetical protein